MTTGLKNRDILFVVVGCCCAWKMLVERMVDGSLLVWSFVMWILDDDELDKASLRSTFICFVSRS